MKTSRDSSMETIAASVAALGGKIERHDETGKAFCSAYFRPGLESVATGWRIAGIHWRDDVFSLTLHGGHGQHGKPEKITLSVGLRMLNFEDTKNNVLQILAPDIDGQVRVEYGVALNPGAASLERECFSISWFPNASPQEMEKEVRRGWRLGEQHFRETFEPIQSLASAAREPAFPWVYAPEMVEMLELSARPAEVILQGLAGVAANTPALSRRSLADDCKTLP